MVTAIFDNFNDFPFKRKALEVNGVIKITLL